MFNMNSSRVSKFISAPSLNNLNIERVDRTAAGPGAPQHRQQHADLASGTALLDMLRHPLLNPKQEEAGNETHRQRHRGTEGILQQRYNEPLGGLGRGGHNKGSLHSGVLALGKLLWLLGERDPPVFAGVGDLIVDEYVVVRSEKLWLFGKIDKRDIFGSFRGARGLRVDIREKEVYLLHSVNGLITRLRDWGIEAKVLFDDSLNDVKLSTIYLWWLQKKRFKPTSVVNAVWRWVLENALLGEKRGCEVQEQRTKSSQSA